MSSSGMTLPMVTCPLCCRPGFNTSDSLCSALVDVTIRKLCCPICNYMVIGLDKFTIHLFSHSLNKSRLDKSEGSNHICHSEIEPVSHPLLSNLSGKVLDFDSLDNNYNCDNNLLKLENTSQEEINVKPNEKFSSKFSNPDVQKNINISDSSLLCLRTENGQLFAISSDYLGTSLKNVTINTQNYITNTNITTSTVQTSVVENVQKRKYSEVFEYDCSDNMNKNCDISSPDNYSNIESVQSCPSTSSVTSESDKSPNNIIMDREFESCKDLLTKGDFTTLSDEIGELDIKKDCSFIGHDINDDVDCGMSEKNDPEMKKENFICELCLFEFPNKTILAMHKQLIHKKVEIETENKRKQLLCNMCPRAFSLRSSLLIHRKVAHAGGFGNNESGNFTKQVPPKPACQICGKFFKKEIHLTQHMKAHDEKQWQCTICSKTFTTKYFLKKHRRLHTGETPYKCNKCDKSFTFQQSYHKHLLYHNDEKPYCCAQCGRLFKELSTLHNHERIHSGEKPFSCETCGKAFRQRVSYLVHRRIHTGVMPYKCTACDKSFRYKISQRTHKCSAQPPGVVIRTNGSLVERLQAAMTKVAVEPQQTPILSELDNQAFINLNRSEVSSSEQHDGIKTATSSISMLSTLEESIENNKSSNMGKTVNQIEKPQIYLLVRGPNEQAYYQPLIISQNIDTSEKDNDKNKPLLITNHDEGGTTKDIIEQDITLSKSTNNSLKEEVINSSALKPSNYVISPREGSSNQQLETYEMTTTCEWLPTDNSLTKAISLEEHQIDRNRDTSAMDEILKNLTCPTSVTDAQITKPSSSSVDKTKTDINSDTVIMDSSDIFSFILSPALSSPSDYLGRLLLSPNSVAHSNQGIDSLNTSQVLNNNSCTDGNGQSNLFDVISDDTLKELFFGASN